MKRKLLGAFIIWALALSLASMVAAETQGKLDLKVGDQLYVCNCGEACPCQAIAGHAGKCPCGHDEMVKATVTRIDGSIAYFKAEAWEKERPFKMVGKYACACPAECKCNAISQTPGKCPCGTKMKKAS